MTVHQTKSLEQTKKSMAEQLWLNYYNQTLFENGLITEAERNRMKNMINALMPLNKLLSGSITKFDAPRF